MRKLLTTFMNRITKTLLLSFLMIVLALSAATSSLNESREIQTLDEENTPQEVILSINSLNVPGYQEGSIFTDTTLSSGETHTCSIIHHPTPVRVYCWYLCSRGRFVKPGWHTYLSKWAWRAMDLAWAWSASNLAGARPKYPSARCTHLHLCFRGLDDRCS